MSKPSTPQIITSVSTLNVPEGGQAAFNVKLSSRPDEKTTVVTAQPTTGDSSISIPSGTSLSFTRRNYNSWQTIILAAAEDSDSSDGQAVIGLSGNGLQPVQVTAKEIDNDQITPVYQIKTDKSTITVAEGASATFNVRLTADPGQLVAVTVGHQSGDLDISVTSGGTYYFDPSNWDSDQPVTLSAAEDADTRPCLPFLHLVRIRFL